MNSYFEDFCKKDVRPIQSRLRKRDIFELQLSIDCVSDILDQMNSTVGNSSLRPITEEICDLYALYQTLFTNLKNAATQDNLLRKVCSDQRTSTILDDTRRIRSDISECSNLIAKFSETQMDITNLCTLFAEICNCIMDCPKTDFPFKKFHINSIIDDIKIRSVVYKCYHDKREYMIGAVMALSGIIEKIMNVYDMIDQTGDYIGKVLNAQVQAREKRNCRYYYEIASKYANKEDDN